MRRTYPLRPGAPDRIGVYEVTGLIGEGGQGTVYLGIGPQGEQVAIKVLHFFRNGHEARKRLAREIEAAQMVAGYTARVLGSGDYEGSPYIVSEYIDGESLLEIIERDGPYDVGQLNRLACGTASALTAIHTAGIVHCDFTPANILLGTDGYRVIDFGIARALDTISRSEGGRFGTPAYMAPEQISTGFSGSLGPWTDVFAWASTMVFAATGRPPFGFNEQNTLTWDRILHDEPNLTGVPDLLRDIISLCLIKHCGRRPAASDVLSGVLGVGPIRELLPLGTQIGDPLTGHTRTIACVTYGKPGDRPVAVTGSHDRTARVWDLTEHAQLGPALPHDGAVLAVACGAVGGRGVVVTGCQDHTIGLWDLAEGERISEPLTGHSGAVVSIALGELGGTPIAVSVSDDRSVRLWDLTKHRELGPPLIHNNTVMSVACTTVEGKPVAVTGGAFDQAVRIWDLTDRQQLGQQLTGHTSTVMSVTCGTLSTGQPVAITGGYDQTVRIWDLTTRRQDGIPLMHSSAVMSVAFGWLGACPVVVSSGADRSVRVWDLSTREQIGDPLTTGLATGPAPSAAFGQLDGRPVALTCGSDLAMRIWSLGPPRRASLRLT